MESPTIRLLLIEDDEDDYILTRDMLRRAEVARFQLDWITNYREGLEALSRGNHEAALIDYVLGPKNGLDLVREAIRQGVQIPLILLTGQGSYSVDVEAMRAGATDYVVKEEATAALLERTIRYALERKAAEQALRRAQEELEWRVEERTAELVDAYRELKDEINERKRAEKRLKSLAELSHALAEAGPDERQVFQLVVRRVTELIGDNCTLALISAAGDQLEIAAIYHQDPEGLELLNSIARETIYRIGEGLAGRVALTGEAVYLKDIDTQAARTITNPAYRAYVERFGVYSTLIVPLRIQRRVIGTLGVTRAARGSHYTLEDQAFLQQLADRAALAIANVRLFQALQGELSERRRAEEALRASETRFRTIFREGVIGIGLVSLEGVILAANPALQLMMGMSEDEMLGRRVHDLSYPEDQPAFDEMFQDLIAGKHQSFYTEKRFVQKGGQVVWGRMGVSLVRDQEGRSQFSVAMIEDITIQHRIEEELAEVQHRLTESREIERVHLARELHDGPVQDLYAVSYQLKSLQDLLDEEWSEPESPDRAQAKLAAVQAMLTHTIQVLRSTSRELRPPALAAFGLQKTIASHAEAFQRKYPQIDLQLDLVADGQSLPENVRLALFRIYQQSLVNIVRHSNATQVNVRFEIEDGEILLEVCDNGAGFHVPATWVDLVREGHLGLAGAAERAETLGGRLDVESEPGQGTRLTVRVPYPSGGPDQLQKRQF